MTDEQDVWFWAFKRAESLPTTNEIAFGYADLVLKEYRARFPMPTAEDKPAVNSVKGVYVTREMLAKAAANLRPNWSQTDRLLMVEQFSKELGLSE